MKLVRKYIQVTIDTSGDAVEYTIAINMINIDTPVACTSIYTSSAKLQGAARVNISGHQ